MGMPVRYTFSLISPFSYLGADAFFDLANRAGANITYRPIAIGKVFSETGGLPPAKRHPSRQAYRLTELARWKEARGKTAMKMQPAFFPADDSLATSFVNAVIAEGGNPQNLITAFHRLVWEDDGNIADAPTLQEVGAKQGYDMVRMQSAAQSGEIAGLRDVHTQEAIDEGIFGAPWFQVAGQDFWGQDNIERIGKLLSA